MVLHRPLLGKTHLLLHRHLRYFSQSAAALVLPYDPEAPLTYLPEFPKPDPSETITAIPRSESGKKICAHERKAGRVPSIVFEQKDGQHGGNKRLISVQTKQIKKLVAQMGSSFFLSRLFDLHVKPTFDSDDIVENVRVLPRKVQFFCCFVVGF